MTENEEPDTSWIRKAFNMDFVGPERPRPALPIDTRAPLRKVMESIPLSQLGATLQAMSLDDEQWKKLASSKLMKSATTKWRDLIDGTKYIFFHPEVFNPWKDLTYLYKTFDDFKGSTHFRFLTSTLQLNEILTEYNASNRKKLESIFLNLDSSTPNKKLKKKILNALKDEAISESSKPFLAVLLYAILSTIGHIADIDTFIGIICKQLSRGETNATGSTICKIQASTSTTNSNPSEIWIIKKENINLRNGPGTKYKTITKLSTPNRITILESKIDSDWIRIETHIDGLPFEGWIYKKFAAKISL
ncbi:SH3 domain-containing protein [Pseudomonas sp. B21-023]|uniref:SH3 domain-containing protein n=1 Tax=Pseudomonas sp. B21-023 TaxID=2895477 RepID=UPI0021602743|nr:SH3 domain-containing protein [Pseudomonas sp. B21-023]UVM18351.1 SH3 domain-containing protein [Pseudomonas sp. B21-023]